MVIAAIFTAGCSSPAKVESNVKTAEINAVANKSNAAAVNQPDTRIETPANDNKMVLRDTSVIGKHTEIWRNKNPGGKASAPIAANVGEVVTPAPDYSEVSSRMNEKGQPLETRRFKNHPQAAKIERLDLNDSDIKVYLKNGKVLPLPPDKAAIFLTATAAEILEAIGMKSGE